MIIKFKEYLNQPRPPFKKVETEDSEERETNIIQFWNKYKFNELAQLSKELLVIPGSSVSRECDRSSAEYAIRLIYIG